ncbi:MAG: hypothetical protein QOG43_2485 [Actinomycetota bacterium]|jgi:hypothetical protein|nr:hypothetical protein [Actinomycetota bacterium]
MATALEATTAIQDKMFSAMQFGQKAMLDGVKTWADTVETIYAKLPDLMTAEPMKPTQAFATSVAFTEKVIASQQDFTAKLFEAMLPVAKAAATPPKPKP